MKTENPRIVVDTYAWIEYFAGTRRGEHVKTYLSGAEMAYTPDLVSAEIARKYLREEVDRDTLERRLKVVEELTVVVCVDQKIALGAAEAYIELLNHSKRLGLKTKPSLADAIVLATARSLNAKVLTGDAHFRHLEETLWIGEE